MSLFKLFHKPKADETPCVETIKEFFMYHHGDGMSMFRDDPKAYAQYRDLKEEITENWQQELIAKDFELLSRNHTENSWIIVGNLIRLISTSQTHVESHFNKLLVLIIELAPSLDCHQRILILEHFAGRTASQKDGGIYLILNKTALKAPLITAVNTLADFSVDTSDNTAQIGWKNTPQRFADVQTAIQRAFQKWGVL